MTRVQNAFKNGKSLPKEASPEPLKGSEYMVGATGIEPVTPTMST